MNPEKFESHREFEQETTANTPAVESFLDSARAAEVWPPDIVNNEMFVEQIKARQELNQNLDAVQSLLPRPDIALMDAIRAGNISEEQVTKLYASLSELLANKDYQRIALYLPFEFLPNPSYRPATEELQQAAAQLRKDYLEAWGNLLSVHDVRANFIDGDVLEVEQRQGDLPRVVKAAHLIPKLVESGLLKAKDVIFLIEDNDDQILRDSAADTLPVLADLGFLTKEDIDYMASAKDPALRAAAQAIISGPENPAAAKATALPDIKQKLHAKFRQIEDKERGPITAKRAAWLKQQERQTAITESGKAISAAIIEDKLDIADFLPPETDTAATQALIEGIRQAVETTGPKEARALYERHQKTLLNLWQQNIPELRPALEKTFYHLRGLGLIDSEQLAQLDIVIPKLAGPFSENLKAMEKDLADIRAAVSAIESNPELARLVYPVAMVYGSRLKGYGGASADIDVAVFVRPGIGASERANLTTLLNQTFNQETVRGEVTQFYLEETDGQLEVIDFPELNPLLGESTDSHVLFGAAWEGSENAMRELREKLLVPYLRETDKTVHDRAVRGLYLEEIERDALQYRLMHKGYERFFPPRGGINTAHADKIDGQSAFYDSGYRQIATKLFASRVFLPKLPAPQK